MFYLFRMCSTYFCLSLRRIGPFTSLHGQPYVIFYFLLKVTLYEVTCLSDLPKYNLIPGTKIYLNIKKSSPVKYCYYLIWIVSKFVKNKNGNHAPIILVLQLRYTCTWVIEIILLRLPSAIQNDKLLRAGFSILE